jgi:DNA-directed DNA polymerase III PolC
VYLNCHSYYSLRYGTLSIDQLVSTAKLMGAEALALTDVNCVTGAFDFVKECEKQGIKPIIGVDFRNGNKQLFIGIAHNLEGYRELNELLSLHSESKQPLPKLAPAFSNVAVIYPLSNLPNKLKENEHIGIKPNEVHHLVKPSLAAYSNKMLVLQPVSFEGKKQYNLHRLLRGVEHNTLLSKLTENDLAAPTESFVSIDKLLSYYEAYPKLIFNTQQLFSTCSFSFDFSTLKNKKVFTDSKHNDKELLYKLALEGMAIRYKANHQKALERINKEIDIIDKLGFSGYFLITWDIIQFSKSKGYYHVGRGSGANSIVGYCIGITNVCPLELDLYFERFLNPSRSSPPDFDIDWSWQERDDILDYIFARYPKNHVAFTGTIGTFKHKSISRELGKVLGLPKEELDALSRNRNDASNSTKLLDTISKYGDLLKGFPNMRSMHSCGVIVSEKPLTYYSALDMYPKGYPTVQWDMYTSEAIGFEKFDILSQRGLGHISDCIKLLKENRNIEVEIHNTETFKKDNKLNQMLAAGDTLGCFYIESPAMRGLLRRLKCKTYDTLVAASSVIRPGVAKSGMMREYVFRHNNPSKFQYFHAVFKEHLGDTYGVMVYQEDVIKIAHHFADLDLSEADILRRAMSGKTRSIKELDKVKGKFFTNCKTKGYPEKLTEEVYRQIESFAGYSFCKSHSASYAVESYQSLYLKAYYPIEFMVAVINNFGGFYRTEVYFHEARRAGAIIKNPCVNNSEYLTGLNGKTIYIGFNHIHNLNAETASAIIKERELFGDYLSLEDFINRITIGVETLETLIFIKAFNFTGKSKSELVLEGRILLSSYAKYKPKQTLFEEPSKSYKLPKFEVSSFSDAFDEIELLSFPNSYSPFEILKTKYRGNVFAKDLPNLHGKVIKMLAYLISRKQVPTIKGTMYFGTWVDVEGNYFDTTHFPQNLYQYPFQGGGCYLLLGKVQVDFSFPSLEIIKMAKLPFIEDPRFSEIANKGLSRLKEDVSSTDRKPYPSEKEIGLPRIEIAL